VTQLAYISDTAWLYLW